MNVDVMNRDMLIAACLTLLDQVATEHPAGHQGKLAARFTIRSRSGERIGLMFEKGGRTKPYLWAARIHARGLLESDVEFRVYLASSLYLEPDAEQKPNYGRHSALKPMRDLANADLVRFSIDRVGQMELVLEKLAAV